MKKSSRIILAIYLPIVLLISCTQSKTPPTVNFPEVDTLVGEKLTAINPYSLIEMEIFDSLLIFISNDGDNVFQIYNTVTDSLILETGNIGKGPGEFIDPHLAIHGNMNRNNTLEIFDGTRRRLTSIDILGTLRSGIMVYDQKSLNKKLGVIDRLYYQSDSNVYYKGDEKDRFTIFNIQNSNKTVISYLTPNMKYNIDDSRGRAVFQSEVELNISRNIIVTAPKYLGQLDYFDLSGNYLYTSVFNKIDNLRDKLNDSHEFDFKLQINDIKSDADIIYALNVNCYNPEVEQDVKSELLLFDWNGNPIKKYILDRAIGCFAVDFKNQYMYGWAFFEYEYSIYKYKL
ncbi:MAG: hypothetical protein JW842_10560 [Prolixibacteraceae bacterium]|nr:hypothetical protein [Prolixibacteraceae bacterium]